MSKKKTKEKKPKGPVISPQEESGDPSGNPPTPPPNPPGGGKP